MEIIQYNADDIALFLVPWNCTIPSDILYYFMVSNLFHISHHQMISRFSFEYLYCLSLQTQVIVKPNRGWQELLSIALDTLFFDQAIAEHAF